MGHLQQVHGRHAASKQLGVDALLDVAGEQESMLVELAEQDDRHVVDRGAAIGRLERHTVGVRPEDAKPDLVERQAIPGR
jgi:hypothetical protein